MTSYQQADNWDCLQTGNAKTSKHGINNNVYNFQAAVKKLLKKDEQKDLTYILQCYNRNRNAYYLAQSMKSLLDTPEKKRILSLLKEIIPKTDRPSFDQFTCEETYMSHPVHSRGSSLSQLCTNDSGIGSNHREHDCVSKASDFSNYKRTSHSDQLPRRSSSLSDLSRKAGKAKTFAGTFGSAVRRKVRAVLARRDSSSNVEFKSSVQRRYNSETKLNKIGKSVNEAKPLAAGPPVSRAKSRTGSTSSLTTIKLRRGRQNEFGFTIGGGSEVGSGIFVSDVEAGSPAYDAGLSKGDFILKVNEMQFDIGVTHDTAVAVMSTLDNLTMLVRPVKSPKYQAADLPWADVHGRPASPPLTVSKRGNLFPKPVLDSRRSSVHLLQAGERKVNLTVRQGQSLGLVIRGGSEYGLGVYVTGIDPRSAADIAGLKIGDEILEVNNVRLIGATHAEAVSVIKSSPILMMIVRFVGRVPQNQHTFDDRVSLHSTSNKRINHSVTKNKINGMKGKFQRKVISEKQMILPNKSPANHSAVRVSAVMTALEEALLSSPGWMTLTDFERRSVRYYVKEYAVGNVDTDTLVLTLTELLDSSEKLALMSAVRECIDSRDLDHFDVLVLRKEVESLKSLQELHSGKGNNFSGSVDTSSQHSAPSEDHSFISRSGSDFQNSTPVDHNSDPSPNAESLSLSPVAPTELIPTPPSKIPPPKPKRSSSLTRNCVFDSVSPSATDEEGSDKSEKRPRSPFSIALESHRSSHSGRVKAGNKLAHKPLPDPEFFKDPKEKPADVEPVYSSLIKPIKKPTSNSLKVERASQNSNTSPSDHAPSSSHASLLNIAPSSVSADPPTPHPPLQQKIVLRPTSFGSSVNQKIRSYQHPVQVDVHRDPSLKQNQSERHSQTRVDSNKIKHDQELSSGFNDTSSDGDDEIPPFLKPDVETQKVVIFRRASNLGLTVEGGAGTKQSLPRVLRIQPGSCAQFSGRIQVGHVIHEVNGNSLSGLEHHDAVRVIAQAFKQESRDSIEFVMSGPH